MKTITKTLTEIRLYSMTVDLQNKSLIAVFQRLDSDGNVYDTKEVTFFETMPEGDPLPEWFPMQFPIPSFAIAIDAMKAAIEQRFLTD